MKIIEIELEKCINCLECVAECPSHLFLEEKNDSENIVSYADPYSCCNQCGHCLSICPTDAIIYQSVEKVIKIPKNSMDFNTLFPQLKLLMQTKRSTRRYLPKPVSDSEIKEVLDVMKYAPSASNARSWKFLVITDQKKIKTLSKKIVNAISLTRKLVTNFFIKNFFIWGQLRKTIKKPSFTISMDRIISNSLAGKDPIFYNAPCVIILYSPSYGNLAGSDSGIIMTYGMLAAETLGLGSCWIGFAQETLQRLKSLSKFIGIPRGYTTWGCFVLGKPVPKFKGIPPKTDLSVKRI
jgi:nitroreductase/NAD-dependent dihydropyrimidine dehydrogenase PreA subunit